MSLEEIAISTKEELLSFIREYEDKGFYFRGENKDNEEKYCLPSYLRNQNQMSNTVGDPNNLWFQKILENLGAGFPYISPKSDNDGDIIVSALLNTPEGRHHLWDDEKLQALIQHYSPDLKALNKALSNVGFEQIGKTTFFSQFLDITSDIFVALHFACSSYHFFSSDEEQKYLSSKNTDDGFLFLFNQDDIENAEYLKLVSHQTHSYFCKKGDSDGFQSFDRINHQKGAFLAPKTNKAGKVEWKKFQEEIQKICLHKKIIIKGNVKIELYKIFEKTNGLENYFPKIPCTFLIKGNKIQETYKKLKGKTVFN